MCRMDPAQHLPITHSVIEDEIKLSRPVGPSAICPLFMEEVTSCPTHTTLTNLIVTRLVLALVSSLALVCGGDINGLGAKV